MLSIHNRQDLSWVGGNLQRRHFLCVEHNVQLHCNVPIIKFRYRPIRLVRSDELYSSKDSGGARVPGLVTALGSSRPAVQINTEMLFSSQGSVFTINCSSQQNI